MAKDGHKIDTNAWMLTFSDLLTLLLTFFVLFLSMSSMNSLNLKAIFNPMGGTVGPLEKGSKTELGRPLIMPVRSLPEEAEDRLLKVYLELKGVLYEGTPKAHALTIKLEDTEIRIRADERGAVIVLPTAVLFPSGEAALQDQGKRLLSKLGRVLRRFNNLLSVEGHTDSLQPRSARYPTNWELSMGRALSVLHYLVDEVKLLPQRFSATGHAGLRPVMSSDTPAGRAQNRRVEIVLLKSRTLWR